MLAAGIGRLVARRAVADVEALDEAEVVQQIERAVDARDARPLTARAQLVGDVAGRQAAAVAREHVDDGDPRSAPAMPGFPEHRARMLAPLRGFHGENDTQVSPGSPRLAQQDVGRAGYRGRACGSR